MHHNGDAAFGGKKESDASGLTGAHDGAHIVLRENAFDCDDIWLIFIKPRNQVRFEFKESLLQWERCSCLDDTNINEGELRSSAAVDNANATSRKSWVHPKNCEGGTPWNMAHNQ
jgi:hypothetical protein